MRVLRLFLFWGEVEAEVFGREVRESPSGFEGSCGCPEVSKRVAHRDLDYGRRGLGMVLQKLAL